jgi:hypothetical protein
VSKVPNSESGYPVVFFRFSSTELMSSSSSSSSSNKRKLQQDSSIDCHDRLCETVLREALARKRQKCSYSTTYSHEMLVPWLLNALKDEAKEWKVIVPERDATVDIEYALKDSLSNWPSKQKRKHVKDWLAGKGHKKPDDLIDGACEPLAIYYSSEVKSSIDKGEFQDLSKITKLAKIKLDNMCARRASEALFKEPFLDAEKNDNRSPKLWGESFEGFYTDYLFGMDSTKIKILEICRSGTIDICPLYLLNYIFDKDELTPSEMEKSNDETAQYSIHVVGLVFDRNKNRIIIADPNGPLIPGSNIELLSIPLQSRSVHSTSVSQYDIDNMYECSSFVNT